MIGNTHIKIKTGLRQRSGNEKGSETNVTTHLQPLLGLLLTLDRQNKGVCALLRDFQLVFLLFAVFRDIRDVAALEQQFHLRLLVLGTFIALHSTGQITVRTEGS